MSEQVAVDALNFISPPRPMFRSELEQTRDLASAYSQANQKLVSTLDEQARLLADVQTELASALATITRIKEVSKALSVAHEENRELQTALDHLEAVASKGLAR